MGQTDTNPSDEHHPPHDPDQPAVRHDTGPQSPPRQPAPRYHPIRETVESVVVALILAFVFRAYVVEAFVIPTGSMAPTLLGAHITLTCPHCGYEFDVSPPGERSSPEASCPMCGNGVPLPLRVQRGISQNNRALIQQGISTGDRILVQKYLYDLVEPRRWDVIVFKAPYQPNINFIKRLVGLPNEDLLIVDGNVYVKPEGEPESSWHIARKTTREDVQRAVWQPIYHSTFVPLSSLSSFPPSIEGRWSPPWTADDPGDWQLESRRSYRHEADDWGVIHFDMDNAVRTAGLFAYNQMGGGNQLRFDEVRNSDNRITSASYVEDVRVAASFQPDSPGLEVALTTTARLDIASREAGQITARIFADGHAALLTQGPDEDEPTVQAEANVGAFTPGIARDVELWYCDQEASLWIDGEKTLTWQYDLPLEQLTRRGTMRHHAQVSIEVNHSPVTLHRVQVDRDIFYSAAQMGRSPRAGFTRDNGHYYYQDDIFTLGSDQFFALGDNSPESQDSRYWPATDEWVKARMIAEGDPTEGVIPRDLLMGRAFFVYWPAPRRVSSDSTWGLIPDFGRMRFIN